MKIIFILLVCLFVLSACEDSKKVQSSKVAEIAEIDAKIEKVITSMLIANLKSNLKDPDSAQLRNMKYYHTDIILLDGSRFPSLHVLCGEVNSKNSFGGYNGYKGFISQEQLRFLDSTVIPDSEYVLIDEGAEDYKRESFRKWAAENCTNKTYSEKAKSDTGNPSNEAKPDTVGVIDGKKIYEGLCIACHGTGAAGAPKAGDKSAWEPRIAQGKGTLFKHAIGGYTGKTGVMPAKGGNSALSDAEVKAAVEHLIGLAKPHVTY